MKEDYYAAGTGGMIPTGLPGGFFIYEAEGDEEILFANNETDPLTGLFNMSFFYHKVQQLLSSHQSRRQQDVSIIHFDVPNFKLCNESRIFTRGKGLDWEKN